MAALARLSQMVARSVVHRAARPAAQTMAYRPYAASAAAAPRETQVVFGATGGIGSELARLLHARGAQLLLAGRDAAKLAALCEELPGAASHVVADAGASADIDAAMAAAAERFGGRLDGVACCYGSVLLKPAASTSDAELAATMAINASAAFYVTRAAVKLMAKPGAGGGSIALCSSAVVRHGIPNHEAIAMAKGAIEGLTRSAAATYAPQNVRVNAVAPGLTRTPMTARITKSEPALAASVGMHALGRIGEAHEPAAALAFLLDPRNSFITGQVLAVDGGLGSLRPQPRK